MNMSRVLGLVQFDFSYSSAILTLNSGFILGLTASKSNPMKAICDLWNQGSFYSNLLGKTHFSLYLCTGSYFHFIPGPTLWIYRALYILTRFSFREKYKCSLSTLLLQSLRPSDSSDHLCRSLFFDKVARWGCATSSKKRL